MKKDYFRKVILPAVFASAAIIPAVAYQNKKFSDYTAAQYALRYSASGSGNRLPERRAVAKEFSGGSADRPAALPRNNIMLVGEKDFDSAEEPPKDTLETLQDIAGGNENNPKKKPVVFMTDKNLTASKITIPSAAQSTGKPAPGMNPVPAPGENSLFSDSSISLPSAPVTYKLFDNQKAWTAFASVHRVNYVPVNFENQSVVVLVSLSDFPSGIFKITEILPAKDTAVLRYRVDPFAMSADNPDARPDFYSAGIVGKKITIISLEQVP
jgi:hypothetical protein